jgi:hypothetical protein
VTAQLAVNGLETDRSHGRDQARAQQGARQARQNKGSAMTTAHRARAHLD